MLLAIGAITYNDMKQVNKLKGLAEKLYRMGMLK